MLVRSQVGEEEHELVSVGCAESGLDDGPRNAATPVPGSVETSSISATVPSE
jgi:hypothetical protein